MVVKSQSSLVKHIILF